MVARQKWLKLIDRMINLLLLICGFIVVWIVMQVFCFATFKIPSDSMSPSLLPGDRIMTNKLLMGARLFNVFDALDMKDVDIRRMPGVSGLKRNDVVVFNFPYGQNRWDSIHFDVMLYYVKRCIGLPGDTLEIRNGYYKVRGFDGDLGNIEAQRFLSGLDDPEKRNIVVEAFPHRTEVGWTIREFGPLAIPKEGQTVKLEERTASLYRQLIEWEQKQRLTCREDTVCLGDSVVHAYRFRKNYYFVAGDNVMSSQDSRYWGLLPEEYIVGKVTRIWTSRDTRTGEFRWNRVLKKVE